ncbi:uncharacterized protein LOC141651724 [Silene latifolia]|uniref:uncharacterized protein LOC141651724 n=1 Tax=Silene latifolia TaxID=37657 RepID=UPI003D773B1A
MTAVKPSSSSIIKNHKNCNKKRINSVDFSISGTSSVVKLASNPVEIEPLDLDDLIADEETEAWVTQGRNKGKTQLSTIHEESEEFILGLWDKYGIDRISFMPSGVFLVRFKRSKDQEAVLNHGHFLFENKPLIVRPWNAQDPLTKSDVSVVPVWVRLLNLPLKFWGQGIPKISGLIGDYVRCDEQTEARTRLGYARVLIDVPFNQHPPKNVKFLDEAGNLVTINVEFEWLPILCKTCGGIGHIDNAWPHSGGFPLATPARAIIRLSRQELLDQGSQAAKFGQCTFMDALNNATPKVGIGTVHELATGEQFYLTMVYAFNGLSERKPLWIRLQDISGQIHSPWIICGDFNTVLAPSERLGGSTTEEEMEDFQNCLDVCHMVDMPATGSLFTWNNKQEAATRVFSRLDRALVNHEWSDQKKEFYAHFHPEGCFDHTPCIIQRLSAMGQRKGSFKYFNMWSTTEHFLPCVTQAWGHRITGTPMFKFVRKLKLLKQPLKQLNRELFADVENNTMRAWKHLESIQSQIRSDPTNPDLIGIEIKAAKEYQELQKACDSFLLQKSKATWIHEGDNNSKVFHSYMKSRQDHRDWLNKPVTNDEIKEALFQTPNHKAPGPDGYSSAFFKDAWSVVGEELCEVVKDFFIHCRLTRVLPEIISPTQGGFIKGRNIIENILVCQEVIRLYNRASVSPRCLIKVDLKKAYDSVNWDFFM